MYELTEFLPANSDILSPLNNILDSWSSPVQDLPCNSPERSLLPSLPPAEGGLWGGCGLFYLLSCLIALFPPGSHHGVVITNNLVAEGGRGCQTRTGRPR